MMFLAWALETTVQRRREIEEMYDRLQATTSRHANNIWIMNKAELIEKALEEMPDWSRAQLMELRVDEIRFYIKKHRDQQRDSEPKSTLPKGLYRMKHQDLVAEAELKGIPTENPKARYGVKTRMELVMDIKNYESTPGGLENQTTEDMPVDMEYFNEEEALAMEPPEEDLQGFQPVKQPRGRSTASSRPLAASSASRLPASRTTASAQISAIRKPVPEDHELDPPRRLAVPAGRSRKA